MFIESANGGYWNLNLCVNYRLDRKGVFHLVFAVVAGGNFKVKPGHPQYRQVERYLRAATLPRD